MNREGAEACWALKLGFAGSCSPEPLGVGYSASMPDATFYGVPCRSVDRLELELLDAWVASPSWGATQQSVIALHERQHLTAASKIADVNLDSYG